jgi:hypothetical protein
VVYFGAELIFKIDTLFENGRTTGMWEMGTLAATLAIFIVNFRMAIEIKYVVLCALCFVDFLFYYIIFFYLYILFILYI